MRTERLGREPPAVGSASRIAHVGSCATSSSSSTAFSHIGVKMLREHASTENNRTTSTSSSTLRAQSQMKLAWCRRKRHAHRKFLCLKSMFVSMALLFNVSAEEEKEGPMSRAFVRMPGIRCNEIVDYYPLGDVFFLLHFNCVCAIHIFF